MRENVWNFVNIFWNGGQNCFLCVQRTFVEKQFSLFWKSSKLSVVFRLWGKHFGFLAKKILLKINFIYEFIKNCFFHELFEFRYCFPTVGRKICKIGAETLEKVSKVHSTWTTELFEESLFSQDNIYFYKSFEFLWKYLRISVRKDSTRFEKLLSTLVQGIFLNNIIIFLEKIYAN